MSGFLRSGDFIVVYVDGSCLNNGCRNASAGYGVVFNENHPENLSSPIQIRGSVTNSAAEAQAATQAIRIAARYNIRKLLIRTDSMMLVNFRENMTTWKQNGWKKAYRWDGSDLCPGNDAPVNNKEDFLSLEQIMYNNSVMDIKFEYVRGHSGDKYNDLADKLADQGAGICRQ